MSLAKIIIDSVLVRYRASIRHFGIVSSRINQGSGNTLDVRCSREIQKDSASETNDLYAMQVRTFKRDRGMNLHHSEISSLHT